MIVEGMKTTPWKEGKVEVLVPDPKVYPPTEKSPVFFNPRARLSRDLSVLSLKVSRVHQIVDAMCATGIRGVRYAVEAGVKRVVFNDINPVAVNLARINAERYGIDAEFLMEDVNLLLNSRKFLAIDLDPFGSPSPFLQATARSIAHGGILMVTATDTSPLTGTAPASAMRKYHTVVKKIEWYRELAVRVLLGYVQHHLMVWEKALIPLLSFFAEHHVRVIGRIVKKPSKVTEAANLMGMLKGIGPIWLGPIKDKEHVTNTISQWDEDYEKRALKTLKILAEELDTVGYYDVHLRSKKLKVSPPPVSEVIEKLREEGYEASRSSLEPRGVKTNAPENVVDNVIGHLS